jgi:hypothetical protein
MGVTTPGRVVDDDTRHPVVQTTAEPSHGNNKHFDVGNQVSKTEKAPSHPCSGASRQYALFYERDLSDSEANWQDGPKIHESATIDYSRRPIKVALVLTRQRAFSLHPVRADRDR